MFNVGTMAVASSSTKSFVFVDGTRLYLGARNLYPDRVLNYRALVDLLCSEVSGLANPGEKGALWTMWTSSSSQNEGQSRFLDFAERDLRWEVRGFGPADSYVLEPTVLFGGRSYDSRSASQLLRFDAAIAFAIGRVVKKSAKKHAPVVVISDSYALRDPLHRAALLSPRHFSLYLVFFRRALDARWRRVLAEESLPVRFIDLDIHAERLFGAARTSPTERSTSESNTLY